MEGSEGNELCSDGEEGSGRRKHRRAKALRQEGWIIGGERTGIMRGKLCLPLGEDGLGPPQCSRDSHVITLCLSLWPCWEHGAAYTEGVVMCEVSQGFHGDTWLGSAPLEAAQRRRCFNQALREGAAHVTRGPRGVHGSPLVAPGCGQSEGVLRVRDICTSQ